LRQLFSVLSERCDRAQSSRAATKPENASASKRAQIVWNVAELPDQLGVAEVGGCGNSRAAEGDRADVARLARERLGLHDGGARIEALVGLASGDAVIGGHEGQGD